MFLLLIKLDAFDKIRCFSCNIFLCLSFENYLFRSLNFYGVLCIFLLLLTVSYICYIPDFPPSYCWLFSFLSGSFDEQRFKKKVYLFLFCMDVCRAHGPRIGCQITWRCSHRWLWVPRLTVRLWSSRTALTRNASKGSFQHFAMFHRDISLFLPRSFWSMRNYVDLFQVLTHSCSFVYLYNALPSLKYFCKKLTCKLIIIGATLSYLWV